MSIFRSVEMNCPKCETPVPFDLVHSVNADRRPDLRAAILDRSFQKKACPACGYAFRVEPEFTYQHLQAGQFIVVWPAAARAQWQEHEAHSRAAFDKSYGAGAPPEARKLGERLRPRCVFGWAALNEKLIAAEAGIDDHTLELAKIGVVRNQPEFDLSGERELRLVNLKGDALLIGWIDTAGDQLVELLSVPSHVIAEIEAEPTAWAALREDIGAGLYVDMQRALVAA
jgi:hypothetical protein